MHAPAPLIPVGDATPLVLADAIHLLENDLEDDDRFLAAADRSGYLGACERYAARTRAILQLRALAGHGDDGGGQPQQQFERRRRVVTCPCCSGLGIVVARR